MRKAACEHEQGRSEDELNAAFVQEAARLFVEGITNIYDKTAGAAAAAREIERAVEEWRRERGKIAGRADSEMGLVTALRKLRAIDEVYKQAKNKPLPVNFGKEMKGLLSGDESSEVRSALDLSAEIRTVSEGDRAAWKRTVTPEAPCLRLSAVRL